LRGPSPFTVAERELIAAYVSGLNACGYCHGIHRVTADAFGVAGERWPRCSTTSTWRRSTRG
jgi:AhpD family alkylhydroperoxidase